jgi:hypothetical protein
MKKSKNKAKNIERGKKKGIKEANRRKVVKAKMLKRKEAVRLEKVKKEQKFQEYLNNLVGQ